MVNLGRNYRANSQVTS